MSDFERLFERVAAEGGELSLTFGLAPLPLVRAERGPQLVEVRLTAKVRAQRFSSIKVMDPRTLKLQRSRGGVEVAYLREAVAEVEDRLVDYLASPAAMLWGGP